MVNFALALLLLKVMLVRVISSPLKRADPKAVFAHVIVGNTYNYNPEKWAVDIQLAHSKAIDAFTMNVGQDSWQPRQVLSAYDTAARVVPAFKFSVSLDMSSLACQTTSDGQYIIDNFIEPLRLHPQRYLYDGKTFLSTFGGQQCLFGQASAPFGWQWLLEKANIPMYFIPNIQTEDTVALARDWSFIDGYKLWSAWPKTDSDDTQWSDDARWLQRLSGKGYLTLVSPWFFIHLPGGNPEINNRYFRGDNFEYRARWEQIIEHRDLLPFVEIATWNDYGESHYIGPMTGVPPNGADYVRPENDHQAWADYTAYFATWYKFGVPPVIVTDRVYMWARPQPKLAPVCDTDGVGRVKNAEWADDLLFVSVFLPAPAEVSCHSGNNTLGPQSLRAGAFELTVALSPGGVGCTLTRGGVTVLRYQPTDYQYQLSPSTCNMNAWTGMVERQDDGGLN